MEDRVSEVKEKTEESVDLQKCMPAYHNDGQTQLTLAC